MPTIIVGGRKMALAREPVPLHTPAPNAELINQAGQLVHLLDLLNDQITVINVTPNVGTAMCSHQTLIFEKLSKQYNFNCLTISMRPPAEFANWKAMSNCQMSTYTDQGFGETYGVKLADYDVLARSVYVIDAQGMIIFHAIPEQMGTEPPYEEIVDVVLQAAKTSNH